MISVPSFNFDMPARTPTSLPPMDREMLHPRDVAGLIRLLIAIQRASADADGWEEVSRLFIRLCDSFSGDAATALRAVREWIGDDAIRDHDAALQSALGHLPAGHSRRDVVDILRDLVAPAVSQAVRLGASYGDNAAVEARLDLCLEHCAQGMMTFSASGTCLFLNRAAARLLRLPVDPQASLVDRRILPRPLRALIELFVADRSPKADWLPTRSLEVGGVRVQCFPLVVAKPGIHGPESLLHLFLTAEAKSEELMERLLRRVHLSKQETFVVRAIIDGKSNAAIAGEMNLSVHTVRTYVERVYEKLDVSNRHELLKLVTSGGDYPALTDDFR